MISVTVFKLRFTSHFWLNIIFVMSVLLFVWLGFWQIDRGHEKQHLLTMQKLAIKQAVLVWHPEDNTPQQYQTIKIRGHFLPQAGLLDNQYDQHRLGYHVLSPFQIENGDVVIVDRGWIADSGMRNSFPEIQTNYATQTLLGSAYYPSAKHISLGQVLEKHGDNLFVIEYIDVALISKLLHKVVCPFIIRLDKHEPDGFGRDWVIVSMPPERHYAYAFQWFAIAVTIIVIFIVLKKKT